MLYKHLRLRLDSCIAKRYNLLVKILDYTVYLQKAPEGGYIVSAPALVGCVTQGETREVALEMIKDAIEGYVASLKKHGEVVPTEVGQIEKVSVSV